MSDTLTYGGRPVVICPLCDRNINAPGVLSCLPNDAHPFGSEPGYERPLDSDYVCRDCNASIGGYHHAHCCVAQCARCGDQWLGCAHYPDVPDPTGYEP